MRNNNLEQFIKLRRELTQEKEGLSRRLAQINEALGEIPAASEAPAEEAPAPAKAAAPARASRAGRKPLGGGASLRELVLEILREGPKTKEEVLAAVQRMGYRFQTNNPLNSLGVILYGKSPKFNRTDGRFSLPGGGVAKSSSTPAQASRSGGAGGGGKRQMSPAARARIAEAQRKRWAATRKGTGSTSSNAQGSAQKNGAAKSGQRQMSPAARKAIADAARRRWAAAKAAGKSRL